MKNRTGETASVKFRADRFFCVSGNWFFDSREHLRIGPFPEKDDAEIELMFFLRHVGEGYTPPPSPESYDVWA